MSRRYEEALEHLSESLRFGPLPLEVKLYKALIHLGLGQQDNARNIVHIVERSTGAQLFLKAWIAEILALCEDKPTAMSIVDEFKLLSPATLLSRFRQASLSLALNDSESALILLSASFEAKEAELPWLAVDPRFDPIRQTSHFSDIVDMVRVRTSS